MKLPIFTLVLPILTIKCCTAMVHLNCDSQDHHQQLITNTDSDEVTMLTQERIKSITMDKELTKELSKEIYLDKKFKKTNELRKLTAYPNRSAREIILENLNAINNPGLYYICVEKFLKTLLFSVPKLYTRNFALSLEPNRLAGAIAIIIDKEIPVLIKKNNHSEILTILNEQKSRKKTPRTWLIFNQHGRIFSKGWII